MSGVNRIIKANSLTPSPKGSALKSALGSAFSPSKIANTKVAKQPIKMPGKSKK